MAQQPSHRASHRLERVRAPHRRRTALVAGPVAVAATTAVVAVGVTLGGGSVDRAADAGLSTPVVSPTSSPSATSIAPTSSPAASITGSALDGPERDLVISRSRSRLPAPLSRSATRAAVRAATTHRWTTTDLDVWTLPGDTAAQVGDLDPGTRVLVTGRMLAGRDEIVVEGASRWVTDGYLSDTKPIAAAAGISTAPCPDSSVEYHLTAGAVQLYRSVCHAFPQITTYGGYAPRGEHASGKALDIMTSDVTLGTAIADWLMAHASELDLYDIIWRQHIWTPERASEGWRLMPDRGSETANHFDHVHVSVN